MLILIYGLIIFPVIVPEKIAELFLYITNINKTNKIKLNNKEWNSRIELKLSLLTIRELRLIAKKIGLYGYSTDNRKILIQRLLLLKEKSKKILIESLIHL